MVVMGSPPPFPFVRQILHPTGSLYDCFKSFSAAHPNASWFQSEHFFRLLLLWPEAEPVLLVAVDQRGGVEDGVPGEDRMIAGGDCVNGPAPRIKGSLLAAVIRNDVPGWLNFFPLTGLYERWTARTVVYGGPLLAEGSQRTREEVLQGLLSGLQERVARRSLFSQFRNLCDVSDYKEGFAKQGFRWHDRLNLLVDTSSREKAWMGMSNSRRRQVKKSLAGGAKVVLHPTASQVDAFYDILHDLYAKKVRKPLPSRTFFQALLALSSPSAPACRIILVTYNGRVIGGIVSPVLQGKAMYEWYVCGLDREYREKDVYPSVLATWAALEQASENGVPMFDFMGLGKPQEKYGVRDFKARFGGRWVNFGRFSRVNKRLPFTLAELAFNLKQLRLGKR